MTSTTETTQESAIGVQQRTFLSAQWRWLVLCNYRVSNELVQRHVPKGTELDCFGEQTYLSLVGFMFYNTRILGWKIPGHVNFEELNLRFYVIRRLNDEIRRGVVFIKELVPRAAVSMVARTLYNENYFTVAMRHQIEPNHPSTGGPAISYEFKYKQRWNRISVVGNQSDAYMPDMDSRESFLLEHYWGYCSQRDGGTVEYQVTHPRWKVWQAANVQIGCDFDAIYGPEMGSVLSREPDSVFIADGSEISVAKPVRIA